MKKNLIAAKRFVQKFWKIHKGYSISQKDIVPQEMSGSATNIESVMFLLNNERYVATPNSIEFVGIEDEQGNIIKWVEIVFKYGEC